MATCRKCRDHVITYRMMINGKPYWIGKCTKCGEPFSIDDDEYAETADEIVKRMKRDNNNNFKSFYWR